MSDPAVCSHNIGEKDSNYLNFIYSEKKIKKVLFKRIWVRST